MERDWGQPECQRVNRKIAPLIDVMIGNEEDFSSCLGLHVEGTDESLKQLPVESYKSMIVELTNQFPNLQAVATTLRTVKSASVNDWSALCWHDGSTLESAVHDNLEIFDRVGGGDSFASGLIFGFLSGLDTQTCVNYGAAHGALAMTTPGDTSMASLDEVEALVAGQSARIKR